MDKIVIREATEKDFEGIATVRVKGWQSAYRGQMPDSYLDNLSIEKDTQGLIERNKNPDPTKKTFVAELDNKIIGFVVAGNPRDEDVSPETGEVYAIYVLPEFQGKSAGSRLINAAIVFLIKNGYKKAALWVLETNIKARTWYEKKGWKTDGKTKVEKRENFELHETRYIINI
jgi:ribosomal protein S18 acetylase RimI-like enzyme